MIELYNNSSRVYAYFIALIMAVVFISECIRYFIIKKAMGDQVISDLKQNGFVLLDYVFLRFSSGQFNVAWFYLLYPHLSSGLYRNRYYVDLKVKDAEDRIKKITVRIESVYLFQVENVTYAPPVLN